MTDLRTKSQAVSDDIAALLRARNPLLWIVTREEARVERYLFEATVAAKYIPLTWDCAAGVSNADGARQTFGGRDPGDTFRKPLDATSTQTDGVAIDRWETERTVHDPKENDAAKKARAKASGLVRSVCQQSAFGLLCPEIDIEKLDKAIAEAKQVVEAFNETATLSRISIFVLAGKVSPDDVEAVRAINSEIRELMAEMSTGIANGNVESIREAASRVKGIGEMLATDARAKVQIAVEVGRGVAKKIVSDIKERGSSVDVSGAHLVDKVFTITLKTGETITWNVTKLRAAGKAGAFGPPRCLPTKDLPPADWSTWGPRDRKTVEWLKRHPEVLDEPAIAIASPRPDYLATCFADGQHRVTARQELGLPECSFWLVQVGVEREFRVTGLEAIERIITEGGKS